MRIFFLYRINCQKQQEEISSFGQNNLKHFFFLLLWLETAFNEHKKLPNMVLFECTLITLIP